MSWFVVCVYACMLCCCYVHDIVLYFMLYCAGEVDPMVKFSYGQLTHKFLSSLNPTNLQFKSYPLMGHSSCPQVSMLTALNTFTYMIRLATGRKLCASKLEYALSCSYTRTDTFLG